MLDKIKDTGYGYYFIGHNKIKTIKSKVDEDDYFVVTSNLSSDYFNAVAYKCPIICNIVSDVETSKSGALSDKVRFMHFRDDAYVEAGSRFSELPIKVPYGANEYIKAVTEGIQASIDKKRKGSEKVKVNKKAKDENKPHPEPIKKKETEKKEEPSKSDGKKLYSDIRNKFSKLLDEGKDMNELLKIMKESGTEKPSAKTDIKTLEKILKSLEDVK